MWQGNCYGQSSVETFHPFVPKAGIPEGSRHLEMIDTFGMLGGTDFPGKLGPGLCITLGLLKLLSMTHSYLQAPSCVFLPVYIWKYSQMSCKSKNQTTNQKKTKQTKKSPCFLIAQISMERPGRKQGNRDLFHTSSSGEWLSVEKSRDWTQR